MVQPPPAPPERVRSIQIAQRRAIPPAHVIPVVRPKAFYHSGDSGDVIYSLLWVKNQGGGIFYLGPDTTWETNSKTHHELYHWLLPLVQAQPYIRKAEFAEKKPAAVTHDLNLFRELWMPHHIRTEQRITRLFEAYSRRWASPPLPENEQWIFADPVPMPDFPIVIHRSPRYRNTAFPWHEVARRYSGKLLFVGLKSEYEDWIKTYGPVAEYCPTENALEMAQLVAGAELFIGNQSFPMALALGMKRPLLQETCPATPDCVFRGRENAQYILSGTEEIRWPRYGRRYVAPIPDPNGFYELGPCEGAFGIGDTLTITPLIRALHGKAIMCLPTSMLELATFFAEVCPVKFTEDYPVFKHFSSGGAWHMAEAKLRLFGRWPAPILPSIRISDKEREWAVRELERYKNPIAFVPTCSPKWAWMRQKDPEYWPKIVAPLGLRYHVLQFGLPEYPHVPGTTRFLNYSLRKIAALYSVIGRYVGVDTGDVHMMLAVGGSATVLVPPEQKQYRPREWYYQERAEYILFHEQARIDQAVEALILQ